MYSSTSFWCSCCALKAVADSASVSLGRRLLRIVDMTAYAPAPKERIVMAITWVSLNPDFFAWEEGIVVRYDDQELGVRNSDGLTRFCICLDYLLR